MNGFEWDPRKAEANLRKHGVDFLDAVSVFRDRLRLEWVDDRRDYGEDRFATVGKAAGVVLYVVYTPRGESLRLIMARRATKRECEEYHGHSAF